MIKASRRYCGCSIFFPVVCFLILFFHWSYKTPSIEIYSLEDQITKSLGDKQGYNFMSNILSNNFWRLRPCLEEKLASFASLDEEEIEQIVILVPQDQGFPGYLDQYLRSLRVKTHVVKSIKWPYILSRKYYCLVAEGLTLPTCDPARNLVLSKTRVIKEKDGFSIDVAINNTRITDWGIYQSPRVFVHGVERSFLDQDINDRHDHDKEAWTTFIKDASYAILDHWDRLKERL